MKIEDRNDAIKRLIDAGFEFEYDSDSRTVTIHSYPNCEEADYNLHGFHYFGTGMDYEYALEESDTVEEFIADAHEQYKEFVCKCMERKLKDLTEDLIPSRYRD